MGLPGRTGEEEAPTLPPPEGVWALGCTERMTVGGLWGESWGSRPRDPQKHWQNESGAETQGDCSGTGSGRGRVPCQRAVLSWGSRQAPRGLLSPGCRQDEDQRPEHWKSDCVGGS